MSNILRKIEPLAATLAISAAVVLIHKVPNFPAMLQLERSCLANGQWWRVLTGHLTHWSSDHLLWDLLMFGVLGFVIEHSGRCRFLCLCCVSAIVISAGMLVGPYSVATYRGLSGIDSALFVYFAVSLAVDARSGRSWSGRVVPSCLLVAFVGKLAFETATNSPMFVDTTDSSFTVVPLAHVLGGVTGMAFAICAGCRSLSQAVRSFVDGVGQLRVVAIDGFAKDSLHVEVPETLDHPLLGPAVQIGRDRSCSLGGAQLGQP